MGQAESTWSKEDFLHHFKFSSFDSAIKDQSSMNPVLCATLSGDLGMLRLLLESKADVKAKTHGLVELGYNDGLTVLMAALMSSQSSAMITTLLELNADASAQSNTGTPTLGLAKCPEHVKELLRFRADVNAQHGPLALSPLAVVCGSSDLRTVRALLEARANPNPEIRCLGVTAALSAVTFARANPEAVEIVELLFSYRADLNAQARQSGCFWFALTWAARAQVALFGREACSFQTRETATLPGTTPLLKAAATGHTEMTETLLRLGAEVLPNDRGETPQELAEAYGHEHILPSFQTFAI